MKGICVSICPNRANLQFFPPVFGDDLYASPVMTTKTSVQISTRTSKGPQTLEQQRFQFLIRQIEEARKAFSDLEKRI